MSNKTGTIVRTEERVSPGEDGYPFSILYNHRGDVEEIQENYYGDGFSLKEFLAEGLDPKKSVVESQYSLGDVMRELSQHETNDGSHMLSMQLAENEKLKDVPIWFNRQWLGGSFVRKYMIFGKTFINDKKPVKRRMGKISKERYLNYSFNHEGVHALTNNEINSVFSKVKTKKEVDKLNALYRHVKRNYRKNGSYELNSLDEFIAGAYTMPQFQELLEEVEMPEKLRTKRYIGGRNLGEKFLCVFDHLLRKREDIDLNNYDNVFDYISDITSNIAGSQLNVVLLKGYGIQGDS